MKRLAFSLLTLSATGAAASEPFREIAVRVEHQRTGNIAKCKLLSISEPSPEAARRACSAVQRASAPGAQQSVVRIWLPPAYTGVLVEPTELRPRMNYITSDDGLERFNGRRPVPVSVVFLVNVEGRVERCMPQIDGTPVKLVAAVCELVAKRFRFNAATLDGTPIAHPYSQGFMIPGRNS